MNKTHKKQGKTTAKSLGLKAVFKSDNNLIISTFGSKDNPIILEETIDNLTGEKKLLVDQHSLTFKSELINDKKDLSLKKDQYEVKVNVKNKQGETVRQDLLGFKTILEKEYFGKEYNDNIHIQIIYNLLDVKKILGLHVGNAIETLTNLNRRSNMDYIGLMHPEYSFKELPENEQNKFKKIFKNLIPYNMYFDGVLSREENGIIENYNILRNLSFIRQVCVHDKMLSRLYNYEHHEEYRELYLKNESLYIKDITKFNNSFIKNNKMNFKILFEVLGCQDQDRQAQTKLIKEYYDFILYKDNKNLGFNLKKIRERIIDEIYPEKNRDKKLQPIRTKLNSLFDFCLFRHYNQARSEEHVQEIISKLRECTNDEEKEKVYKDEYNHLKEIGVTEVCSKIAKSIERNVRNKNIFVTRPIENIIKVPSLESFPLAIYTLCKFLDTKEVNELLTSIINKFENILSLIKTLEMVEITTNKELSTNNVINYKNIDKWLKDFRLVKNLTSTKSKLKKVNQNDAVVGKPLYADAINLFKKDDFVSINDPEGCGLQLYINSFHDKPKNAPRNFKTPGQQTRNFILNNIIKNRRFIYLIKYIDPKQCYKLVHNDKLLRFALGEYDENQMPIKQLKKYYSAIVKTTTEIEDRKRKIMIDRIVETIKTISIDTLFNIGEKLVTNRDNSYSEHQKQLISLYLTIAYTIVKGMIHTNSIYFIGWSMFDRDYQYKFGKELENNEEYLSLTKSYNSSKKKRVKELIDHNIKEVDDNVDLMLFKDYRNKVTHLNFCSNFTEYLDGIGTVKSYFDIYTFVVQKWAVEGQTKYFKSEEYLNKLKEDLNKYHTYQRNFLKIINLPFAYNLARYKNLTIGDLFNDKYPVPKEVMEEYYNEEK